MYPIDFATCTARDVIARSITCHPSLFAERLADLAKEHAAYARKTHDTTAARSAERLALACELASGSEDPDEICDDFNARIVAFSVACDLQLIPRHHRGDIVEREECTS